MKISIDTKISLDEIKNSFENKKLLAKWEQKRAFLIL